jgi:hypothetical protein
MYVPLVLSDDTSRSQMASSSCSSICEKKGICQKSTMPKVRPQCQQSLEKMPMIYCVATHSADDGEAEVALDLTAEVERQRLEDGLLVDAPSCQPLVLEEPSDTLLELQGKLTVMHPLLDVAPLHPPLLQTHFNRLQVCLQRKHQTM